MPSLKEHLRKAAGVAARGGWTEEDTKIKLVVPLLIAIGIDVFSPEAACWETPCRADAAFDGALILETKPFGHKIENRGGIISLDPNANGADDLGQICAYCHNWNNGKPPFALPPLAAMTNGKCWHVFWAGKLAELAEAETKARPAGMAMATVGCERAAVDGSPFDIIDDENRLSEKTLNRLTAVLRR